MFINIVIKLIILNNVILFFISQLLQMNYYGLKKWFGAIFINIVMAKEVVAAGAI